MVAIKQSTTELHDTNLSDNNAHIYVARLDDAHTHIIDWKEGTYGEWHWAKYQIKESDMRAKTATFTSQNYVDLTTGVYMVLITSTMHEDFGGVIISVDYDTKTGLYDYQCQDFSRFYQSKFELITNGKIKAYRVLQYLISRGNIPIEGTIKNLDQYKDELSGLRPAYQYDQKYWGNVMSYNMMDNKNLMIIRNKSFIEAIRDLVYGSGSFIDVHFNKYGVLQLEPYLKDEFYNTGLTLTTPELAQSKYKFDTTNVITGVRVHSTDKTDVGKMYTSEKVLNLDLTAFFGTLGTTIDNPQSTSGTTSTGKKGKKGSTGSGKDSKKSTKKTNTSNPYNTKKKRVYINTDNIDGKSTDSKFISDIAKLLKKQGWETKTKGVGANTHYHIDVKDGVWFCIYGGADAGLLKEQAGPSAYKNMEKKLNSRTVIGFKKKPGSKHPCDIRKGGKCYKWLVRSSDNKPGFKGLSYPSKVLAKGKVPFMYAATAEDMVAKFLKGGDEPNAL